ncbi:MAG: nitrogen fixation protein NifH [Chloroflexi bacterium]|nr:nitrogen fixation protein NifH [Chloroflexota bacterium]
MSSPSAFDQTLAWLLEPDEALPSVRYLALRELLGLPADDPQVCAAHGQVMHAGPVPRILEHQAAEGYWDKPGPGYADKYTGTIWQVVMLAQLGADGADPRVRAAGEYVLSHSRAPCGGFSMTATAGGLIHCLQGNLCAALLDLGWQGDPRLAEAVDWLARSITGEGIASSEDSAATVHYLRSANCAPGFCCSGNDRLPCAWGAVKAVIALGKAPESLRTPAFQAAIRQGAAFLLSRDPAAADYPAGYAAKPNGSWFKPGMPIGYVADVLQILEALSALGFGADPRLQNAFDWLLSKQDAQGRWLMEYTYNGKTWADIEAKGQPSKWVTLRALRVLQHCAVPT